MLVIDHVVSVGEVETVHVIYDQDHVDGDLAELEEGEHVLVLGMRSQLPMLVIREPMPVLEEREHLLRRVVLEV